MSLIVDVGEYSMCIHLDNVCVVVSLDLINKTAVASFQVLPTHILLAGFTHYTFDQIQTWVTC